MDSFELNKYAGGILAALLTLFGTKTVLDIVLRPHAAAKPGYVLPVAVKSADGHGGAAAPAKLDLAASLPKADVANGESVFKACLACHSVDKGVAKPTGPNLYGVIGRKVASTAFDYSEAMKGFGGEWSYDRIATYISDPKGTVPGNKMSFAGVKDQTDLVDVVAFLRSKSDSPPPLPK